MAVQVRGLAPELALFRRAAADPPAEPPRLLLWEGWDERVRFAAGALTASGLARPVLFAHHQPEERWAALDADLVAESWLAQAGGGDEGGRGEVRHGPPSGDAELAAAALSLGFVEAAVGGADTSTPEVLRAGLRRVGARRTVSIAFFVRPRHGAKAGHLYLIADIGAVPSPDSAQLVDIALESADTWRRATGEEPRLAFLGISTKSKAAAAVAAAVERVRAERPSLTVDGELQADVAVSREVAARKDPDGPIAGSANVLIVPSLEGGNISYKLLQRLGGAEVFGVTQGFRRPFHDVSRGCDERELLDTVLYCAADLCVGAA